MVEKRHEFTSEQSHASVNFLKNITDSIILYKNRLETKRLLEKARELCPEADKSYYFTNNDPLWEAFTILRVPPAGSKYELEGVHIQDFGGRMYAENQLIVREGVTLERGLLLTYDYHSGTPIVHVESPNP